MRDKYKARCIASYSVTIPPCALVDQNQRHICKVPDKELSYSEGDTTGFPSKRERNAFLKYNVGKWAAID